MFRSKKPTYLSKKLVEDELSEFKYTLRPQIEQRYLDKYGNACSYQVFLSPMSSAYVLAFNEIYYDNSTERSQRSVWNQLELIHDIREFSKVNPNAPRFIQKYRSYSAYRRIERIFSGCACYSQTGTLPDDFYHALMIKSEDLPEDSIEVYVNYVEEVIRELLNEITSMALRQMELFFPGTLREFNETTAKEIAEEPNSQLMAAST